MKTPEEITIWCDMMLNSHPNIEDTNFFNSIKDYMKDIEADENAPTVEEIEKPFITECRDNAIENNLPLYFVYYEETGIFDVYVTETKELFERRHCSKNLPNYIFKDIATSYLDYYLDWKGVTQ